MICDFIMFSADYEGDLLDIRLNTLNNVVDKFIIGESDYSHSGIKKDFCLDRLVCERFQKFADKIIYIKIPYVKSNNPWNMEMFSRDYIYQAYKDKMQDNDLILIGDLDEIPNPKYISEDYYSINHQPIGLVMTGYTQCLDMKCSDTFFGTIFLQKKDIQMPVWWLRNHRSNFENKFFLHVEYNQNGLGMAGWHFSTVADLDGIVKKLKYFAHVNDFKDEYKTIEHALKAIRIKGSVLDPEPVRKFDIIDIVYPNLPQYLVDNQNKFKHLFYKNYI